MYSNEPIRYRNNGRKGPDLVMKLISLASIALWVILIINLGIIFSAKPRDATFFDRLFHVKVRTYWDIRLLTVALRVSAGQLAVSIISLFLNTRRLKRKYDKIRISIIISLISSALLCILLSLYLYA